MRIQINGNGEELDTTTTVADLLHARYAEATSVAVAINKEFVPRSQHADRVLVENEEVEIVSPQAGG